MWTSKLGNKYPKEDIERSDSKHHSILNALRKEAANSVCAECGDVGTSWASVNLGVFVCVRCSDIHRALGTHVSKVKGCSGTYLWGPDEIENMQRLGNAAADARYGGRCSAARPAESATKEERVKMCRRKYEDLEWAAEAASTKYCSFTPSTTAQGASVPPVTIPSNLSTSGERARLSTGQQTSASMSTGPIKSCNKDPRPQAKEALDMDFDDFFGKMGLSEPAPAATRKALQQANAGRSNEDGECAAQLAPSTSPSKSKPTTAQAHQESLEQCFPGNSQNDSAGTFALQPVDFPAKSSQPAQPGSDNLWNDFGAW